MLSTLLALLTTGYAAPARDLGHPDYRTREAAEARLAAAWPYTAPRLLRAARSPDPEVRRRAAAAYHRGAYRVLGPYAAHPLADWPAVLAVRLDCGDADGLPATPDGLAEAVGTESLARVGRRMHLLGRDERLPGEQSTEYAWWSYFPTITLTDLRWRYRGLDGLSGDDAVAAWAESRRRGR